MIERRLGIGLLAVVMMSCERPDPTRSRPTPTERASQSTAATASASANEQPPEPVEPRAALPPLPDPLPGRRKDVSSVVGSSLRAAIGDFDGDGDPEIVLVDAGQMRIVEPSGRELARAPVTRGIQVLVAADLDGDGRDAIFAGWGITRDHMETRATITVHRLQADRLVEETLLAPSTTRQDVVAIVPMRESGSLLLAYFESKYIVKSVVAKPGSSGWETSPIASLRTATSYARGDVDGDGAVDLVVGRVYGDETGSAGDAFVLEPGGERIPIPTTRGLRSLAIADADGDGRPEIFLGDGWHQNYGQHARGLLTWVRHVDGGFQSERIENSAGQYAIERIVPAAIDGRPAIVTSGSHFVRVFTRAEDRWRGVTIAGAARDVAVGDLDGVPGDEIVIVAERSEIVDLRAPSPP